MEILGFLYAYRYLGIFLATIFEGPLTMIAVGFLYKLGHFNFFLAYSIMVLGDLVGDVGWYYLGYFGGNKFFIKFGKYIGVEEKSIEKVRALFHKHHNKILFISKITNSLGMAVAILVTAGISKIPMKKFIILNILGGLVWTLMMMAVGYFFGNVYSTVTGGLRIGLTVGMALLAVVALYGFGKFLKGKVMKNKI